MAPLERWNQLTNFVTVVLWSGQVANGRPQSTVLVSGPGEGKTELLERFDENAVATFWTDLTSRTILGFILPEIREGSTHIVCTELQKLMNRKKETAYAALTLLLQGMEEGIKRIGQGPYMKQFAGLRFGLIAATTQSSLLDHPFIIRGIEMDSRAFFIDATGTDAELAEIMKRVNRGDYRALTKVKIKAPQKKVDVTWPANLADIVQHDWLTEMRKQDVPVYGLRTHMRFLRLLQGVAAMNGRKTVNRSDLDYLYSFRNLWLKLPRMIRERSSDYA
jgi:hypothetical protein